MRDRHQSRGSELGEQRVDTSPIMNELERGTKDKNTR